MEQRLLERLEAEIFLITDPREGPASLRRHLLFDILVIALCSTIVGGDGFEAMYVFGTSKASWLSTFLELPHGIPSVSTFRRVISSIEPKEFNLLLAVTSSDCHKLLASSKEPVGVDEDRKKTIAFDGKTLRGSHVRSQGLKALHTVSAFDTEADLTLAQVSVDSKSNEITAIPELLDIISIKGAVVTCDAMGCQKSLAKKIQSKGGGFVFALKENHGILYDNVKKVFSDIPILQDAPKELNVFTETEKGHGRIEIRSCLAIGRVNVIGLYGWDTVATFVAIDSTREVDGNMTVERRFYISDQPADSRLLANYIRSHWRVENNLHWILDVTFDEDASRARIKNAHANLAILRRAALNLIKSETSQKLSKKMKRFKAGLDNDLLEKILFQSSVLAI